jgi:hypothetical protein
VAYDEGVVHLTTLDGDGASGIRWDRVTATALGSGVVPALALGVLEDEPGVVESSPEYPLTSAETLTIEV